MVRSWVDVAPDSEFLNGLFFEDPDTRRVRLSLPDAIATSALILLVCGCVTPAAAPPTSWRPFDFDRDTFAFVNEAYWDYGFEAGSALATGPSDDPDEYIQRCVLMAKAVRQFFYGARFAPDEPPATEAEYRALVRRVLETDPRRDEPVPDRVTIPGYPDLHAFSRDHAAMLKRQTGGLWRSYVQRGNWRMIFPFAARQQHGTARELLADVTRGHPPIVHLVNFPRITINHSVLIYHGEETPTEIRFLAYDPNDSENPVLLVFERASSTFRFPRTHYFGGGPVKAYEVYDGLFF